MKVIITSEFNKRFPEVNLVLLLVENVTVKQDSRILTTDHFNKQLNKFKDRDDFYNQDLFVAFRNFYQELGFDTKIDLPSVENLYRRYEETGKISQINNIVDTLNKVAVETLVPTGVFDLSAISGNMVLRLSYKGEEFRPLGGGIEYLPEGIAVIADQEKILNRFPYRDSIYQVVTKKTKDVLLVGDKVKGVSLEKTREAVIQGGRLLKKIAGGKTEKVFYPEVRESKVVGPKEARKKRLEVKKRVFSGIRATGRLHLGNYLGAVKGMIALQADDSFETIFGVVDLHTMTTPYDSQTLSETAKEVMLDYLSSGLDPEKSIIYKQSDLADLLTQLMFYFSTVVSVARMRHLPTYKDKVKQHPKHTTVALLNYPILMAADILIYKASAVPVGVDQEPHLEVTREIARRMNKEYGTDFPEPVRFATKGEYIPSLTGEGKMSKSVSGSFINLTDDLETIKRKLACVPTDIGKGDKIPTEGGVVSLLKFVELFQGKGKREKYEKQYLDKGIRYADLKQELAQAIFADLKPIQAKRRQLEAKPDYVEKIIKEGAQRARRIAVRTITETREKMGLI